MVKLLVLFLKHDIFDIPVFPWGGSQIASGSETWLENPTHGPRMAGLSQL